MLAIFHWKCPIYEPVLPTVSDSVVPAVPSCDVVVGVVDWDDESDAVVVTSGASVALSRVVSWASVGDGVGLIVVEAVVVVVTTGDGSEDTYDSPITIMRYYSRRQRCEALEFLSLMELVWWWKQW